MYVDNITIVGSSHDDVEHRSRCVADAFKAAEIPLTWSQEKPVKRLESVGCILDFEQKVLINKPKRVWKFFLATLGLLRRKKIKGKTLQIWTGHYTSLCALTPCGLSCLDHVYRFIDVSQHRRVQVWTSVRKELKLAAALVWLTWRDLGAPLCKTVEVGDSSTTGYALMAARPGEQLIRKAIATHEKWRFIAMPESLKNAAARHDAEAFEKLLQDIMGTDSCEQEKPGAVCRPAGLSTGYAKMVVESLQEGSWLGTSAIRSQIRAKPAKRIDVDVPSLVEPLDDFFADRQNFRLLWSRRWRDSDEHINIKECRVALSSLKRSCRVRELMSHRKLTISDNMATVSALSKGRSGSFSLNKLCRVAAAFQLGRGMIWHLRHVETKRNVADEPSRNFNRGARNREGGPSVVAPDPCSGLSAEPSQSSKRGLFGDAVRGAVPCGKSSFFLELFAGTGRLSRAVADAGAPVLEAVEVLNDPAFDLRRRQTQRLILSWIKSGTIGFVHLGTPCPIWSRARHGVRNTLRNLAREAEGVELALFTCEVILARNKNRIPWALENPKSSRLFTFEPLVKAMHTGPLFEVNFDMCSYGEQYKKDTKIFTSASCLRALERHCCHRRHSVWLKGQQRVEFPGGKFVYKNRTSLAGAYPDSFCRLYAKLLVHAGHCSSHGETDQHIQDHWSASIRCYTPKSKTSGTGRQRKAAVSAGDNPPDETKLELLAKQGGPDQFFDFVALGREPKQAWLYLKKNKTKLDPQDRAVQQDP